MSHAQIDKQTAQGDQTGWVGYLAEALNVELKSDGQINESIWREGWDIREDTQIEEVIQDELEAAELIVLIVSPVCVKWS